MAMTQRPSPEPSGFQGKFGSLAKTSHADLIRLFVDNPHDHQINKEFKSRYDAFIKRTVAKGLDGCKNWCAGEQRHNVEDVVSEVYYRLFRNDYQALREFRSKYKNSIFAYLRTICLNLSRNKIRDEMRESTFTQLGLSSTGSDNPEPVADLEDFSHRVESAAHEAESNDWEKTVHDKLCESFQSERAHRNFILFKLFYVYGYHLYEIANIKGLGLGESGVGNTAARIRTRLRHQFNALA